MWICYNVAVKVKITSTQRYYTGGSKPLFTGGLANRLCLVACGNKFFHRRVTENRLWKSISIGGSVMPTACRNLLVKNMKSVFKNRKKKILIQGRLTGYPPARLRMKSSCRNTWFLHAVLLEKPPVKIDFHRRFCIRVSLIFSTGVF